MNAPKVLTLDLETSPMLVYTWGLFKQDIGINQIVEHTRVISWAAKWFGKPGVMFASEFHDGREQMLERIHALLGEADAVVHWNGTSFDMPHLRREFKLAGMPPHNPVQEIDLMRVAKSRFYFPSYKLQYVSTQLGLAGKVSHTGFDLWRQCLAGDEKAWSLMRKYNKGDVTVTEQVYEQLLPWINKHPNLGHYADGDACPNCGSDSMQKRGFYYTDASVFQKFWCKACGKWSRSAKSEGRTQLRGIA